MVVCCIGYWEEGYENSGASLSTLNASNDVNTAKVEVEVLMVAYPALKIGDNDDDVADADAAEAVQEEREASKPRQALVPAHVPVPSNETYTVAPNQAQPDQAHPH